MASDGGRLLAEHLTGLIQPPDEAGMIKKRDKSLLGFHSIRKPGQGRMVFLQNFGYHGRKYITELASPQLSS